MKKRAPKPPESVVSGHTGGIDFSAVRELARIASDFDLVEVEADLAGHIRVRRGAEGGGPVSGAALKGPPSITLAPPPPVDGPAEPGTFITSPFVGTFYRASSPESSVFVEVGQSVRKGQVVCIIEAMKLMNEIEAESDGKILQILVENGKHVEYGQNLFRVAKS